MAEDVEAIAAIIAAWIAPHPGIGAIDVPHHRPAGGEAGRALGDGAGGEAELPGDQILDVAEARVLAVGVRPGAELDRLLAEQSEHPQTVE